MKRSLLVVILLFFIGGKAISQTPSKTTIPYSDCLVLDTKWNEDDWAPFKFWINQYFGGSVWFASYAPPLHVMSYLEPGLGFSYQIEPIYQRYYNKHLGVQCGLGFEWDSYSFNNGNLRYDGSNFFLDNNWATGLSYYNDYSPYANLTTSYLHLVCGLKLRDDPKGIISIGLSALPGIKVGGKFSSYVAASSSTTNKTNLEEYKLPFMNNFTCDIRLDICYSGWLHAFVQVPTTRLFDSSREEHIYALKFGVAFLTMDGIQQIINR